MINRSTPRAHRRRRSGGAGAYGRLELAFPAAADSAADGGGCVSTGVIRSPRWAMRLSPRAACCRFDPLAHCGKWGVLRIAPPKQVAAGKREAPERLEQPAR